MWLCKFIRDLFKQEPEEKKLKAIEKEHNKSFEPVVDQSDDKTYESVLRDWTKKALDVVAFFETGGKNWGKSAGNFDGAGISCGILQWNIKFGSQQPLVKEWLSLDPEKNERPYLSDLMPNYFNWYYELIHTKSLRSATRKAAAKAPNYRVPYRLRKELKALWDSPEMREIQLKHAMEKGDWAMGKTIEWSNFYKTSFLKWVVFAVYFDLRINNGGHRYKRLGRWHAVNPRSDIESPKNIAHYMKRVADVQSNNVKKTADIIIAQDNEQNLLGAKKPLLDLIYRRHQKSVKRYIGLTMARKCIFILGEGYLNGSHVVVDKNSYEQIEKKEITS